MTTLSFDSFFKEIVHVWSWLNAPHVPISYKASVKSSQNVRVNAPHGIISRNRLKYKFADIPLKNVLYHIHAFQWVVCELVRMTVLWKATKLTLQLKPRARRASSPCFTTRVAPFHLLSSNLAESYIQEVLHWKNTHFLFLTECYS